MTDEAEGGFDDRGGLHEFHFRATLSDRPHKAAGPGCKRASVDISRAKPLSYPSPACSPQAARTLLETVSPYYFHSSTKSAHRFSANSRSPMGGQRGQWAGVESDPDR